ncbi:hypothetical protein [Litoreibacter roseus]|uniref:Uncharacterized protein n=1 Tax=Litoreibacter roseus TaxID=2601869 RepID=A0A6N6JGH7_9RHOB|nr:hypothetical protein [Litoreibacter roseus]GFE65336.1 hypothetical protein KIN_24100 [Litoreibacter roseus]
MKREYQRLTEDAVHLLNEARRRLTDEISQYPTPISGCDAQFNHLLAERSKITRAVGALGSEVFVPTPRMPDPARRMESR